MAENITKRGLRYYVYFKRGHATYLAMLVGMGSAVGIWYALLGFDLFFMSIIEFALVFVPVYVCTCVILGWQDFKRGVYQREVEVQRAQNKITIEILEKLNDILVILRNEE